MTPSKWSWKEASLPRELLHKLASRFAISIYEAALEGEPTQVDILVNLGELYTRAGLFEKGLKVDQRLVEVEPDEPSFHYNLACSHSLLGNLDVAFEALTRAIQLGYDKVEHLRDDPDLDNLKKDSRYHEILKDLASKQAQK